MIIIRIGRAVRILSTPVGMDMTGYIGRLGPSTGTHDPLHVRCVALEADGGCVVLAVCELLGLSDGVAGDIQRRAAARAGLPPESVVVCCTHTHSGPASIHLENCGTVDSRWLADTADLVEDLTPARLTLATGRCRAAFNRIAGHSTEEDERLDSQVSILRVTPRDGLRPPLLLLNYACHPVTLSEPNRLYSADFPFFTEQALRATGSPGLDLVFLPGSCGDLDPVFRGGFDAAERTGKALATAVVEAGRPILSESAFEDGELRVDTVALRLRVPRRFTDAQLTSMIEDEVAHPLPADAVPDVSQRVRKARADYARRTLGASADGSLLAAVTAEVKVIRLGGLVMVTHPFEAFNEVGQAIKSLYGPGTTMVIGYAGGNFGYLPSQRLYDQAAYEVGEAFLYYGYPGPLPRTAAAELLAALPR